MPNRQRSLGKKNKVNYSCSDLPAKCKFSFRRRKKKRIEMFQYIDNFHYFFYISGHFPGQINRKKDSVTNYQVSQ